MMDWNGFVDKLLSEKGEFEDINLSISINNKSFGIPPIVKASITILDKVVEKQGKYNILVFPEREETAFVFTLSKLFYNIAKGRIGVKYNPKGFISGDKLRLGKAVVEFVGIEEQYGKICMHVHLADMDYWAPVDFFPFFQKTTAKRLNKSNVYFAEQKKFKEQSSVISFEENYLKMLADNKTHMDSSIVYVTTLTKAKSAVAECKLCNKNLGDLVFFGASDYKGDVKSLGIGQMTGIPAVVLSSDLYAVGGLVDKGHPIQSIIVDIASNDALLREIDALNDLMKYNIPITFLTDMVNSFDLQQLTARGFNVWRWDKNSITEKLYNKDTTSSNREIKNCSEKAVEYLHADCSEINKVLHMVLKHKQEVQDLSKQMDDVYSAFCKISFSVARRICPYEDEQIGSFTDELAEIDTILDNEKNFISREIYADYKLSCSELRDIVNHNEKLSKIKELEEYLKVNNYDSTCIIIPEGTDKKVVEKYWDKILLQRRINTEVVFLYPSEYYDVRCDRFSITIIAGWLKRPIMRKILYSFKTSKYLLLLYRCEEKWRDYALAKWKKALDSTSNSEVLRNSFAIENLYDALQEADTKEILTTIDLESDEYLEVEEAARRSNYRKYEYANRNDTIEAIPINFVGGYIMFSNQNHEIISATDIIVNAGKRVKMIFPKEVKMGDFIVLRDSDKEVIRKLADRILLKKGAADAREKANKWREALIIERLFDTDDKICEKLQAAGCQKGVQAIKTWLNDEEIIAPQSREDLEYIAKITENEVLYELMDEVFECAQIVRTAHIRAGRILSRILKQSLAYALQELGEIDVFNIWGPLELTVEGVGNVQILKVIDVGETVKVNITDTNRLILEG